MWLLVCVTDLLRKWQGKTDKLSWRAPEISPAYQEAVFRQFEEQQKWNEELSIAIDRENIDDSR